MPSPDVKPCLPACAPAGLHARLRLGLVRLLSLLLFLPGLALAAPFAYIANYGSDNVSVIDTATDTVTATVAVGSRPFGVAVNSAGTRVYVTNLVSNTVSVIDTASNAVTATVSVGNGPYGVAVNPAGTRVYAANSASNTVSVIDTASNTVTATVTVGSGPEGVAVNPAGTRVYVANRGGNSVSVIDATTNLVTATVTVGSGPIGVAVNPAGTHVYVTNLIGNTVSVIDATSNAVTATVTVGSGPADMAINPAGTRVYVTNHNGNTVSVIDTASNAVTATVAGLNSPTGAAMDPAGTRVYVANTLSNSVSVIDAASNAVTATVAVGSIPYAFGQFIAAAAADTTPDAFSFTAQTGVALSSLTISNAITVAGINTADVAISISGGSYSINGGAYTSAPGVVNNGDTVSVQQTSSASFGTLTTATVTIGGVSGAFDVTTLAADTTPDAFGFTAQTNVALSTVATSNSITVAGINTASAIGIVGGEYAVSSDSGVTWSPWSASVPATVSLNDQVKVRQTSSASLGTLTTATLTIGGVSGAFDVTTLAADTTPDAFSFTAQTNVALSTVATSNSITVAGINTAAAISIAGGSYSINGGSYTSVAGTVSNGQTVSVQQTSSASFGVMTTATLTIDGVNGDFDVTTQGPVTSYTAPAATGTGDITASFTGDAGCGYTVSQYIPLSGHAASPPAGTAPAGFVFPHGLFDFTTSGCTPGSTITMVITYPQTLPAGTVYWKYGPTPTDASYHWYQLPATIAGNTATFSITDGGLGDDDLTPNGTIVDQGGPGVPAEAAAIPTLSEWAMLLLAGLMGLFGVGAMRRPSSGRPA